MHENNNVNEKNIEVGACVGATSSRPKKINMAGISLISLIITIIVEWIFIFLGFIS